MVMLVELAVSVGVALDKHQVIGVAGIVQVAVGLVRCLGWWEEEQREAFLYVTSQSCNLDSEKLIFRPPTCQKLLSKLVLGMICTAFHR